MNPKSEFKKLPNAIQVPVLLFIGFFFGILAGLNFSPLSFWWISLLGLTGFFCLLMNMGIRLGLTLSFFFWLGFLITCMSWMQSGLAIYSNVTDTQAALVSLAIQVFLALMLSLPFCTLFIFKKLSLQRALAIPLIWILGEWSRYLMFDGLPWVIIGYAHHATWLSGWIPIFGVLGGSYFAALCAATAAFIIQSKTQQSKVLLGFFFILAIWLLGLGLSFYNWTKAMDIEIPVSMVQPNRAVSFGGRTDINERDRKRMATIEILSAGLWKEDSLLIWPEGGISLKSEHLDDYIKELHAFAASSKTALFTGGPLYVEVDGAEQSLNSVYGLGSAQGIYNKIHRAPLGEYAPWGGRLGKIFPIFSSSEPPSAKGKAIQDPLLFYLAGNELLAATSICYEISFGDTFRHQASAANILINFSNDAWFNNTAQIGQALEIAQIRALEHQKPLVRATNSGLTGIINYQGKITQLLPALQQSHLSGKISPRAGSTPYAILGDPPIFFLGALLLSCLSIPSLRKSILKKLDWD